jgi:hypothetical protein
MVWQNAQGGMREMKIKLTNAHIFLIAVFWINTQMKGDGREMHFFAPALPPPLSTFVA